MPGHTKIAIIGWGSLIWDLDVLAPQTDLNWRMNAGPRLAMEFTRVSPKRKFGLAVCLDDISGVECPTHVIASTRDDIADAVRDLAIRERTDPQNIGAVCRNTGLSNSTRDQVARAVDDWCVQSGFSGAVWTDIGPNFHESNGEAFTVERGIAYLQTLREESLDEAVRYIENAPHGTDTPLRRALSREPWWVQEAMRLQLR
ncbi:MAG: hypothetical protein AAGD47_02325 [Pseudomonadota bacterium]